MGNDFKSSKPKPTWSKIQGNAGMSPNEANAYLNSHGESMAPGFIQADISSGTRDVREGYGGGVGRAVYDKANQEQPPKQTEIRRDMNSMHEVSKRVSQQSDATRTRRK